MTRRYSLHHIYSDKLSNLSFSPSDYSRFKFGCKDIARKFGFELAEGFLLDHDYDKLEKMGQIVVISSPYQFIPTATFAMKDYFIQRLNMALMLGDLPVVQEARIYRDITYHDDYGEMSAEQRKNLIGGDSFYVDAHYLKGKTVFLMDDVCITGSHEDMIRNMLMQQNVEARNIFYMYFAELKNKNVNPRIENELNYFKVKQLMDVNKIIHNGSFLFNTRVVKYILKSEPIAFLNFIKDQDHKFRETLSHLAIGNSYHTIDRYKENLSNLLTINMVYKNSEQASAGMVN